MSENGWVVACCVDNSTHLIYQSPFSTLPPLQHIQTHVHTHTHIYKLGMGSVGRRSCVQLASYIAGCNYRQLTPGYQHSTSETQEDLKPVLLKCGVKNQSFVLLVSEVIGEQVQIVDKSVILYHIT